MNYYLKRVLRSGVTLYVVITLTFALTRLMPGGPADFVKAKIRRNNPAARPAQINRMVEQYIAVQPDSPLWQQYINYFVSIFQFDFGTSFFYNRPVLNIYAEALPWTLFIMGVALIISLAISIALGAFLAYKEGSDLDYALSTFSVVMNSIPYYIAGVFLIVIFAYTFEIFPSGNRTSLGIEAGFTLNYFLDILWHATLPIASVVITAFGGRALRMRGNSIRVLGEDYIRVARLRGLRSGRIRLQYVARNAVLPIYTSIMIQIGFMMGGSIILEEIFQYPGVGYYFFRSISSRDYPLMMGGFLIITIAVVVAVMIADLTYGLIDPRASSGGDSHEAF
ncbi:ABC transporter permease [Halosimplex pelagicum]|uniref:ABC transporter permease n=1 Tax=Halosimplex pelagicum TaxID=869886 RepID=A0A7D5TSK1_9EURY|nr:ABC transporter permease [Halosimplex pelagicum]QLH82052.1 ABC transporter permease [Halosimplex pelagicum]